MIKINIPTDTDTIRKLKTGDRVALSGVIVTGRDEIHRRLFTRFDEKAAAMMKGSFIYHCGPIVMQADGKYTITACGPTTSIREEPYQAEIIKRYGLKGVIGKGGMGDATLSGLKECGAVYLQATGGAAALLAKSIEEVIDVHYLKEFGTPEAMWVIRVKDLPLVVTMDSRGESLHKKVLEESSKKQAMLMG